MDISILSIKGKDTGRKVSLDKKIFGIDPNDHAIYLDVKSFLAANRQGTHKSKERAEITGSTRKIKKQKGTGTARAGSIKSPIFRGGGRAFGPRPRDYSFKLNKKIKVLARKSALSYKAKSESISIVEDFSFETIKTKNYFEVLNGLGLADKKSVFVFAESDRNVLLSCQNIKNSKVIQVGELSTYEVLNSDNLVISESAIEKLHNILN